jgi:hypothetical protein
MIIPAAATVAWAAAIYQGGDEGTWLSYARLQYRPAFLDYVWRNTHNIGSLFLELLPASIMLPFIPWPWRRGCKGAKVPAIVAPVVLYSGICTLVLVLWPGFNTRYAMPIAPSLAVLAGIAWDELEKSGYLAVRRFAAVALSLLIIYQFVLVVVIMPLFAERFGETRLAGKAIEQAIRSTPAPAYCQRIDTNILFYVHEPFRCLDLHGLAALTPPAWLLIPAPVVAEFAQLRSDLQVHIAAGPLTEAQLTATRIEAK